MHSSKWCSSSSLLPSLLLNEFSKYIKIHVYALLTESYELICKVTNIFVNDLNGSEMSTHESKNETYKLLTSKILINIIYGKLFDQIK